MATETTPVPARLSDEAVTPLSTLDAVAPLDDLGWLDEAIGDARVVAIGESAHYNHETYQLRHRLLRYLAERHGFTAYATESGFCEGWRADEWVRGAGGADDLGGVLAGGLTSLMGLWTPMRTQLEWMRRHTLPLGFYGIDVPGSVMSLLPGLEAVLGYLASADPEFVVTPRLHETASSYAAESAFSAPQSLAAYGKLAAEDRDALTASLSDLAARMAACRIDYVNRTGSEAYERARHAVRLTVALDAMLRELSNGGPNGLHASIRDAAMADTVEWILRREERIVLAAHNGHIQRCPVALPGMAPSTTMGMHLADRLGDGYLVIGTTSTRGHTLNLGADFYTGTLFTTMGEPEAGSLDALMTASHNGLFATDLRTLSTTDATAVQSVTRLRAGAFYCDLAPLDAFDLVVHLPHVTPAEPDQATLTHAPDEVQQVFTQWKPS